jgi:chromosome segregation ATPase
LEHFDFSELPKKIEDVNAAIKRGEANIVDLQKQLNQALNQNYEDGGDGGVGYLSRELEQARGEVELLNNALKVLDKTQEEHEGSKGNQADRAAQLAKAEADRKKQLEEAAAERKKKQQQEFLQQDIAINEAKIEAAKRVQDAEIQQDEQAARTIIQQHKASAEEEMATETRLENEKNQAEEKYLADKLKQLERNRGQNKQQIIATQAEIEALHIQHQTKLNQIHDDYQQRLEKDAQQALRDEVKHVEEKVAETKAGSQERIKILEDELAKLTAEHKTDTEEFKRLEKEKAQAVRDQAKEMEAAQQERVKSEQQHEQALESMQRSRLDFERQIGKISESEYEARLKAELDADFAHEKKQLEIERDRYQQGTKDYEKYQAELIKLTDKHDAEIEKLEQKSYQRRRQQFDQYFKQVSSSFNTALNGWMQGTETASQAFGKMFQDILSQLINFVEQWIEKKIEMWLMDKFISEGSQSAASAEEIESNAAVAYSGAYAATAAIPLVGPELAPEAAWMAYMDVMSMMPAGFALGGIVPATGLALVHEGERVLPASMSGTGNFGLSNVHVHFNVSAIDSDSFKTTIKRHGNMIGNEVARVLKKKGMAAKY